MRNGGRHIRSSKQIPQQKEIASNSFPGKSCQTLIVTRLLFLANSLAFSLLGVSQAASKSSKLSQKSLSERCCAVLVCRFFCLGKAKQRCNTRVLQGVLTRH